MRTPATSRSTVNLLPLPQVIALGLVLAAGCVPDATDGTFSEQVIEVPSEEIVGEIADGAGPGPGTMTGQWIQVHENSACLSASALSGNEVLSYTYYVLDLEQDGKLVHERQRKICSTDLSEVLNLRPIVPPETLASVQVPSIDSGFVSTPGLGGTYSSPTEILLWGLDLDDVVNQELPQDANDPAVADRNNDGNPGVTFEIENSDCERYIVQRTVSRYQGNYTTPNRIDGTSATRTETYNLEATGLCGVNIELIPNDEYSTFVMLRADGDGTNLDLRNDDGVVTCEALNEIRNQIMPRRAPRGENCPRRR